MGTVVVRPVFQEDRTYTIEMTMADGTRKLVKGFAWKVEAEALLAQQKRSAPKDEVWTRRPLFDTRF